MSKAQTIGIIIVIAVFLAVGYFLYKKGFPLPGFLKEFFKFFDSISRNINNFFAGAGEFLNNIGKNIDNALKQAGEQVNAELDKLKDAKAITNPIEIQNLASRSPNTTRSKSFTDTPTQKTTQITTTTTQGTINPNTGSLHMTEPQKITIKLTESLSFTEKQGNAIVAAKQQSAPLRVQQREFIPSQSSKVPNPLPERQNLFDLILSDLQNLFKSINPSTPVLPVVAPFPAPIVPVIP